MAHSPAIQSMSSDRNRRSLAYHPAVRLRPKANVDTEDVPTSLAQSLATSLGKYDYAHPDSPEAQRTFRSRSQHRILVPEN
jgi:hypothetical protein